jgi:hypothetical protein
MKYFEVQKETISAMPIVYTVASDGSQVGQEFESDTMVENMTVGFNVWEYEEDGTTIGVQFYPVMTDTRDWRNNELQVLETIKYDHQPDEWQNNEW